MNRALTLRIVLAMALAGLASSQTNTKDTKPNDVDGWGKIKWGMTIAEARAAYNVESPLEATEYWNFLRLQSIKIDDIPMDVDAMAARGSDQITRVQLTWIFYGHPGGPSGSQGFDKLKTLLIQKYGAPASDETKREFGDLTKEVLWVFPSTSVLLKLGNVSVNLTHKTIDKKAIDALSGKNL